ncbi:MAG TPA: tetratricopeptide repeat protein [Candidatus Acidoferrum sp.]|nr:tetratricopeptide repeat protein [Candidatus Acidoferrum sp.]
MRRVVWLLVLVAVSLAQNSGGNSERLWQLRNLGKALYENPTTQAQAVDQFRQALALAPDSVRERVNYGLAMLRAGKVPEGVAELERAQKQDPALPHTWFNLGIAYKRQGDFDRSLAQFEQMSKLRPEEPISHYQLGSLYKLKGDSAAAIREFETARQLNPRLAAPHFQLYGMYRQAERATDAAAELAVFQSLKKQQEGAAVPEDMEWSYYAEIYDPAPAPGVAPAPLTWRDEVVADGFVDGGVTMLGTNLIAWSKDKVAMFRNGRTPVPNTGLESLRDVVFIAPGDFDNDGAIDLAVVTTTGAALYRNEAGNFRKFADLAKGSFRTAFWLDFDHDYDPDLFLLGDDSRLMRNNGAAGFSDETKRFPFVAESAQAVQPVELEPEDPAFDFVVSYPNGAVRYRDLLGGTWQASPPMKMDRAATPVTADLDGTGRVSRANIAADGKLHVERAAAANYGNWIEIGLTGVKNAKVPLEARVEVKAGSNYQRATYRGVPLVFRLGSHTMVDTVRITWPNGLVQNETNRPANRIYTIKEAPRLSGSCPMIFTWNGERFEFITDVLGVAPLGASSGDGEFFPVDHDEYVSIPGERLRAKDGRYQVRVTEELREVSYLDQIQLIALDHPAGSDIVTNEKFKAPPFPEFRLYRAGPRVYPSRAREADGRDVRAALIARDGVYPDDFRRDHAGVAELHTLDLDFGAAASKNQAALILHGWVDWADGSTFLAATQAKRDLVFPYLQVKDETGAWKTVIEDMGIPSGKPKTMAVDLTGKFLSKSREVRIVTNLCVYWDEIFLVEDASAPQAKMTPVPMVSADLHFRGFSRATIHPERKQPERFDYNMVSFTSMWNPTSGNYTRYGAVTELLAKPDDRMVVMGSGDEASLLFDAGSLPPVAAGWKRDFLLLVDGWAKDADANTAFSQTVLPLPFHAMSRYPYPAREHYPDDAAHREYLREYLTRPALKLTRPLSE